MLHLVGAKLRRLGALFALILAVFVAAPMAQAECICDVEIAASAANAAAATADDQGAGDANCICPACHCIHAGSETPSPFKAISLAVFAVEQAAPLNDARLLPLPSNTPERPPRG